MSQWQLSIFMILIGVTLIWTANGLCFTLVALRLSSEQFATYEIGIVTTGYFIGQMICAGLLENVISKVGNKSHLRLWHQLGPKQVLPKTTPASVVLDPRASDLN